MKEKSGTKICKNNRRGFTLVEMMATTVLVAVILPAALKALSIISALTSESTHRSIALNLAESRLSELLATGDWESGYLEGDFDDYRQKFLQTDYNLRETNLDGYRWVLIPNDSKTSLSEITIAVYWTSRGVEKHLTLSTLKQQQ